eukprot:GAHX01001342.1.p1 GENE.GAHX01001342.1~~GAHX01001342.1.p1  ORF type:complete len:125 (+),score=16.36 GAHX01001342.1:36-410(+)
MNKISLHAHAGVILVILFMVDVVLGMDLNWTPVDESEVPKHHPIDKYKSYMLHLKDCDHSKKNELLKLIHPIRKQFGPKHESTMKERHEKGGDFHSTWLIEEEYDHILKHFSECLLVSGKADEL